MTDLLKQPFSHVINGKLYDAKDAKTIDVIDPATEKTITKVPVATKEVLNEAVKAGHEAFLKWKTTTWAERAKLVTEVGKEYKALAPQLIDLMSLEQGKSKFQAKGEVELVFEWFDRMIDMEPKEFVSLEKDDFKVIERFVPLGVTAGIVPWNFPILLMVWKIIPAILTGNTIIIKPSPFTPLSDVRVVELFNKHLPPGVVQIVLGDDNLGPWITEHPDIRKISFTGSTQTGRLVAKSCSATLKRFTLELGGNDANVILPDVADINATAQSVLFSAFGNSGQVCHASKRVYVHEDIYDAFSKALVEVVKQQKVGPATEEGALFGPLNNKMQFDKVTEYFNDSKKSGHTFLTGGDIKRDAGYFLPLSVVDNPPEDSRLVQEEPFGPIVPLLKWKDDEDVLKRVNDSSWGLGAMVFGTDLERVEKLARGIEAGIVWTNVNQQQHPEVAFAGFKSSGVGVENGAAGLKGWTQTQSIYLKK